MLKSAVNFFASQRSGFFFQQSLRYTCMMTEAHLEAVPSVEIDQGIFKYVLIRLYGEKEDGIEISKNIVRGYEDCQWHSDIYERVSFSIQALGLDSECLGGGRIDHNPSAKLIKVYGYSQGYGKADHAIAKTVLKEKYSDYEIQISDDGY